MARIRDSVVIDRPVEDVWRFLMDFANFSKWTIVELKQTSEGPTEVGTTLQASSRFLFRNVEIHQRVTDIEPNRKFCRECTSGFPRRIHLKYDLTVEPVGEGKTKFTHVIEAEFKGLWKLLQPFLVRARRTVIEESDSKLKSVLEVENALRKEETVTA